MIQPAIDELMGRRFSFHPPVRNVRHNEWALRRTTGTECLIANLRSGVEFVIPQSFIRAISHFDEPVMLMTLRRELRRRSRELVPIERTVVELPRGADTEAVQSPAEGRPAAIVGIRIEPNPVRRFARRTSLVLLLAGAAVTIILGIEAGLTQS